MRALTPFLKTCLLVALSTPLQDVLNMRDRISRFGIMGPHIVLVSRLDPQSNAVLVHDGSHSMWAFLPPSSVQVIHRTYPHIRSLKDFRGCVVRVEVSHFSTPRRHTSASHATTSLGRICLHVMSMEILDVPSISPNESPLVLHDPSIASQILDMPLARLEARLLPHNSTSSDQPLHPHNRRYYHAYMFHEGHPLTLEDCIIPSDQWRQVVGDNLKDSLVLAQKRSDSLPLSSSESQAAAGSLPTSASLYTSITTLPSASSALLSNDTPVAADTQATRASSASLATQAPSASPPTRPYAFCHQSLPDNFIVDSDTSPASSAFSNSSQHAYPRPLSTPPIETTDHLRKTMAPSFADKENPLQTSKTTGRAMNSVNTAGSQTPRQPLGNTTNLVSPTLPVDGQLDLAAPHDVLTRKSAKRSATLRRRSKSTSSSSSSSSCKRSRFSSRFDWDDETKDEVAKASPPTRRPCALGLDGPSPRRGCVDELSSPRRAFIHSTYFSQWQTQQETQTRLESSPTTTSPLVRQPPDNEYDLMSVLDERHDSTGDSETARATDFFATMHFRPSIRHGELHAIQLATVDCTAAVLDFIRRGRNARKQQPHALPRPV
ncbi:hypothetical protein H310_10001 [Aphanomyces invadans]|uniref:Uncharacterized protein n=1 Tax=Aphanomyces invadans TaxID=157072 RepID=A0A024TT72_9STRA|nr:hypothetical protein H310_10001 [Aphanomyces invadans]ETV97214.1 hypothetical protein H310_10001 [Aphanomyces invadans]|eukprot:XP_008874460.1 hypothetical protein H310_10001 [Aphanomyces invadans]